MASDVLVYVPEEKWLYMACIGLYGADEKYILFWAVLGRSSWGVQMLPELEKPQV